MEGAGPRLIHEGAITEESVEALAVGFTAMAALEAFCYRNPQWQHVGEYLEGPDGKRVALATLRESVLVGDDLWNTAAERWYWERCCMHLVLVPR